MDIAGEVERAKRSVSTDAYQMSFGEVVNLYQEDDLIINPEFQRLFRWSNAQKSRLIELMLLGIPIPPIFIYELPEGKWELVDGLQRISTVLEFIRSSCETAKVIKSCRPLSSRQRITYLR